MVRRKSRNHLRDEHESGDIPIHRAAFIATEGSVTSRSHHRAAEARAALIGERVTTATAPHTPKSDEDTRPRMSKRAVLLDKDNELLAHPTFAEIDDYMARGLVERLTPVKAKTHVFRLVVVTVASVETADFREYDPCTLTAKMSLLNAGGGDYRENRRAKLRVKVWPHEGDRKAPRVGVKAVSK